MGHVAERSYGKDFSAHAIWRLLDERGGERIRETRIFRRDARRDGSEYRSQWLIVVDAPASVRGIGLLVWARTAGDSDQWLYLPAYRKTRRLGSMDQGEAFLGSEFTFDDLRERRVEDDTHAFLRREERDGEVLAVIESTPRTRIASYASRRTWVDLRHWTTPRVEYVGAGGQPLKTLEARWTEVADVWLWQRLEMRDEQAGRRSIVELDGHRVDTGLSARLFSQSSLRLGIR